MDREGSMDIGSRTDGSPLDEDLDIGKGFVCRSVCDGAHETSRSLRVLCMRCIQDA